MPKVWVLVATAAAVTLVSTGCGRVSTAALPDLSERDTIRVVATTGMVADAVHVVGGPRVVVRALMGPGVDPHLYKASEGDVRRLEEADVIFYSGLHLEAKMADVLERIGDRRRTAAVGAGIPPGELMHPAHFEGQPDPHIWFDVTLWSRAVVQVRDVLAEADRAHAAGYRRRAAQYLAELGTLDREVRARVAAIPPERRVLVTAHDAFGYFGAAYGFEVVGLQGISTASEAGAQDVSRLADMIARRRIPAIFVESSVSPRTVQAVQEAVRSRGFDVGIGGSLYSDAMGSAGTPEGTYPGMVRHNVETIAAALEGDSR